MAEELRSISDARRDLPRLSQAAQKTMDRYIITNQGQPQSVLLGWEEYQGMKAAVELLNRPDALASLEEGLKDLREGRRLTFEEMRENLWNRRQAGGISSLEANATSGPGEEAESVWNKVKNFFEGGADPGPADMSLEQGEDIKLAGEVLRASKDRIGASEVRVRKEILTGMQTVQVPVTRQELVIERRAVSDDHVSIGAAGEIRIPLTEERATIDRSTVVRDEVSVGKRSAESARELPDAVRREELAVEDKSQG